jgi:uncharacterized protein YndB with AHSA1/START domain/transcriptional regulator with XRE-family HTH domain
MSQLDLAMQAGFSARHLSFIETGRTQPSRQALLVLAETLEVPLRERNRLLEAGGYAHIFRQTPLAAEEMGHIRGVLQFILDRHTPYAAVVLDRYSNCLMKNAAAAQLLAAVVDPSLLTEPANLLRMVFHPLGVRQWIVNWDEVARHLLGRAERELGSSRDDDAAVALLADLRGYAGTAQRQQPSATLSAGDLLLPIHLRTHDLEFRIFSTIMTLGTPNDVTLQELRIETFFPTDEASETVWRSIAVAREPGRRVDTASRVIQASPLRLYQAFVDPDALVSWLPPKGMKARIDVFEPRQGGLYRMILAYEVPDHSAPGKTSEHADVVRGKFLELSPNERIVQLVEFESADPAFGGEMKMTWTLTVVPGGTEVSIRAENVPEGIRREDHEAGFRSTLENLAIFAEAR